MKEKPSILSLETAQRFKEFRTKVFVTQPPLAEFLGVRQPLIAKIENGTRILHPDHLKKLVKEKKLNPKWYHTGIGNMLLTEKDTKRNLIVNVDDLKLELELLKSRIEGMESNNRLLLNMIQELRNDLTK